MFQSKEISNLHLDINPNFNVSIMNRPTEVYLEGATNFNNIQIYFPNPKPTCEDYSINMIEELVKQQTICARIRGTAHSLSLKNPRLSLDSSPASPAIVAEFVRCCWVVLVRVIGDSAGMALSSDRG